MDSKPSKKAKLWKFDVVEGPRGEQAANVVRL